MKKCTYCSKSNSSLTIINADKQESQYICLSCQLKQEISNTPKDQQIVNEMIEAYEDIANKMAKIIKNTPDLPKADTPFEFTPTSMYDSVQKALTLLKTEHQLTDSPEKLKAGIQAAVAREDFEKAAALKRLLDQMERNEEN